jgi:hypothetical protein
VQSFSTTKKQNNAKQNKEGMIMRSLLSALLIAFTILLLSGCATVPGPSPGKPDLVVTKFETTGPATVNAQNSVVLPIRVVVKNQGSVVTYIFRTAIEYTGPWGTNIVPFTVPVESDMSYPWTPLSGGGEMEYKGKITFHPSLHNVTLSLVAIADSCSGTPCRVDESNGNNNRSAPISVFLP